MRITKWIHSCMTIEESGDRLLIDPGTYTFRDGSVTLERIGVIDGILITHKHPDHVDVEMLRRILAEKNVPVIGNSDVCAYLEHEGIKAMPHDEGEITLTAFTIRAIPAQHEAILAPELPLNTAYLINGKFLHPGDSLSEALFEYRGVSCFAMPSMAPWATQPTIAKFTIELAPERVIPIHDGYAASEFVDGQNTRYRDYFTSRSIMFHPLVLGESLDC